MTPEEQEAIPEEEEPQKFEPLEKEVPFKLPIQLRRQAAKIKIADLINEHRKRGWKLSPQSKAAKEIQYTPDGTPIGSNSLVDVDGNFLTMTGVLFDFDADLMIDGRYIIYNSWPDYICMKWNGTDWEYLPGYPDKMDTDPDWHTDPAIKAL
jgi:hypothetical protein